MMKREKAKRLKRGLRLLVAVCFAVSLLAVTAYAAESADAQTMPAASGNLEIGLRSTSSLTATDDGYMRVFYDGSKVGIEYYDNSFNLLKKKSLAMEFDIWGGFYAGSDGCYYIAEGRNNTAESDAAEVIRVIKYDKNWNRKGAAKIVGADDEFGKVRYPFDAGCVEMAEYGGKLYVVTGHEGYVDPAYKQGHQGFLMIAVDKAAMTGKIVDFDLWHSFAQYIKAQGSDLYVLEQSEGSRYTKLTKYDASVNAAVPSAKASIPVLEYGGSHTSAWAIACYASVDDMALSSNNVLCLGTSIDQSEYDSVTSDTPHNIYLTLTPKGNFTEEATSVKWLTSYSGGGKSFLGAKLTKVNDDRFMVSWEEYDTQKAASTSDSLSGSVLHYLFIDGSGNKLSKEFTAAAPISDCHPIVKGQNIVYYASSSNMVNFYTINSSTGAFSKKSYRVAGAGATWNISGGVLTVSGSGALTVSSEANHRLPISSTSGWFSYSSSDNDWAPVRDSVKKIVIGKGITSIPESAFKYFSNVAEVKTEDGLKTIGKEAFSSCRALEKITVPASVTKIGENALWTGSYWVGSGGHVVYATIYAPYGSYAIKYAKANNISYSEIKTSISKASVSGISPSYIYTGKAIKPSVTVTLNGKKLKSGTDYTVSYSKNTKVGTATVTIKGTKAYSGTITKTFKITKPLATPKISKVSNVNGGVKVTWGKVKGAAKYRLYYKTGKGSWTKIADTTATSYTWKKPKSGTTYAFTVRCLSKDGKSFTSSYSKTGKSIKYLAAPKITKVTTNSKGVVLSWGKVGGAKTYRVYYKTAKGSWKKLADTKSTGYTVKAATGRNYYYTVKAYNGKTTSGYNTKGTLFKRAATPKLSKVSNVKGGVKISWKKASGAVKYRVYYKTGKGSWKKLADTAATSYTWKNAKKGTKYYFTVRCITKDGKSFTSWYNTAGKAIKAK